MSDKDSIPFHVRESAVHGRGVFAHALIRSGQLIGRFEGVPTQEDGTYVLWIIDENEDQVGIDGRNALRFLNHAGRPNAEFEGQDLYALCDLEAGSEILIHYGEGWKEDESCDVPGKGVIHDEKEAFVVSGRSLC